MIPEVPCIVLGEVLLTQVHDMPLMVILIVMLTSRWACI
jgi:hypothetical protein